MALNIIRVTLDEVGFVRFIYDGKSYSPSEFPFRVHITNYDYVLENSVKRREDVIGNILWIDKCFEKLKGGFVEND